MASAGYTWPPVPPPASTMVATPPPGRSLLHPRRSRPRPGVTRGAHACRTLSPGPLRRCAAAGLPTPPASPRPPGGGCVRHDRRGATRDPALLSDLDLDLDLDLGLGLGLDLDLDLDLD